MRFLDDTQWLALSRLILTINSIEEDHAFRKAVLEELRFLIPYESAAFFLSDLSKDLAMSAAEWRSNPRFIEPVGVDVPVKVLEEYVLRYYLSDPAGRIDILHNAHVFREHDLNAERLDQNYLDYLGDRHVLNCSFVDESGFYGSLNLNRRIEDGDFSDREVQILKVLEPHILNRLAKWHVKADHTTSEATFLHDFSISPRESEVVRCVIKGMSNSEIASSLSISKSTVKKHLENIFRKTEVGSRVELVMLTQRYTG